MADSGLAQIDDARTSARPNSLVRAAITAALVLGAIAGAAIFGPPHLPYGSATSLTNPIDFRAFYCGGRTVAAGADPYLVEPLRSCERATAERMGLHLIPQFVMPVPLPPYALVILSLFARIAYPAATCAWFAAQLIALVATVFALHRVTRLPMPVVALVVLPCAINAALLGQISPFVVLVEIAAASALTAGRVWACAALITLMTFEPHLALPAVGALLCCVPRVRGPLLVLLTALFTITLAFVPAGGYAEYFLRELPSHSLSEVHAFRIQYSLTTALASVAAVPDATAVRLGQLDYAAMLLLGVWVARRFATRFADRSFYVLMPPAFTSLGGMFEHAHDLYIAIPAILLVIRYGGRRLRTLAALSATGLSVSLLLEASFANDFTRAVTSPVVAAFAHAASPGDLASSALGVWQSMLMNVDAATFGSVLALRAPALIGLALFIIACVRLASERTAAAKSFA